MENDRKAKKLKLMKEKVVLTLDNGEVKEYTLNEIEAKFANNEDRMPIVEEDKDKVCIMCRRNDVGTYKVTFRELSGHIISEDDDFNIFDKYSNVYLCSRCSAEVLQDLLTHMNPMESLRLLNRIRSSEEWSYSVRLANEERCKEPREKIKSIFVKHKKCGCKCNQVSSDTTKVTDSIQESLRKDGFDK